MATRAEVGRTLVQGLHAAEVDLAVVDAAPGDPIVDHGGRALLTVVRGALQAGVTTLAPGDGLLVRHGPVVQSTDTAATVLVGRFSTQGSGARLLDDLPEFAPVRAAEEGCRHIAEHLAEPVGDASGAVRARLLDWLLACTVDAWLADPVGRPVDGAASDRAVDAALRAIHDEPAANWTVAGLAVRAGLGRAAFARRFSAAVGTSPLAYVREQRLTLATKALADPALTVDAVAHQVGYADGLTLGAALRRERGVTPSALRQGR